MTADKDDAANEGGEANAGQRASIRPAKAPVTIDLEARPLESPAESTLPPDSPSDGKPAEGPETTAPPLPLTPPTRRGGLLGLMAAGVVGGVIATILGIAYHASGIVPSRAEIAATGAATKAEAVGSAVAALQSRVAALESRPAAATSDSVEALGEKVAALDAGMGDVAGRVATLEARSAITAPVGDGGTSGLAASFADIETRLGRVEAGAAAVVALRERVAAVENAVTELVARVDALAARPAAAGESERAARAVAIAMVRQAAGRGDPFAGEVATLEALGADATAIAALKPLAERGVPSIATLQAGFPSIADKVLIASTSADPEAGILDRIASFGRGLVSIRPTTAIQGDTPEAVVSRMQAAVDRGDLTAALAERAALPAPGQAASAAWASAASDRVAVDGQLADLAQSTAAK